MTADAAAPQEREYQLQPESEDEARVVSSEDQEEAPESEVQASDQDDQDQDEPEKLPPNAKEATRRQFQRLLRERDELKRSVAELKSKVGAPPSLEAADHDIERYTQEYNEYATNDVMARSMDAAAVRAESEALEEMRRVFWDSTQESRKRYKDFDAALSDTSLPFNGTLMELIVSSSEPAEVAYYLSKHKDEAFRISQLPPHMQGYEVAKIDARAVPKPIISQAPPPLEKTRISGAGRIPSSYDEGSYDDFVKRRNKEINERYNRKAR